MVARNRQPLKPDRPLQSFLFSDTGKVCRAVEHLPRTQDDLELVIGQKFSGAISHFRKQRLTEMISGSGRGDLICRNDSGMQVKIQVVEVIDDIQAAWKDRNNSYREHLVWKYPEVFALFNGCRLILFDKYDTAFSPNLRTRHGQIYLDELAKNLKIVGMEIGSLPSGMIRHRKMEIGSPKIPVIFDCERFQPAASNIPCQIFCNFGRATISIEQYVLTNAILKKIQKYYSKPKELFWLLAYSTDVLLRDVDPDVVAAAHALDQAIHHFDTVWYFFPYDNRESGHIVQVWSR